MKETLQKLDNVLNSIGCLVAEGPDVMRSGAIYDAVGKDVTRGRDAVSALRKLLAKQDSTLCPICGVIGGHESWCSVAQRKDSGNNENL